MVILPDHPDLKIFNDLVVFLFVVGLVDIFYILIKSQVLKKNLRKKDHSWQAYWILSIILWIAVWGVYLIDQTGRIDLIN